MMDRLTEYEIIAGHVHAIPKVTDMDAVVAKLAHYEDLAEAGRLIELPCAVEDIVYAADAEPIIPLMVSKIGVYLDGGYCGDWESLSNFGKTIFLNREEAEAALKEREAE